MTGTGGSSSSLLSISNIIQKDIYFSHEATGAIEIFPLLNFGAVSEFEKIEIDKPCDADECIDIRGW